MSQKLPSLEEMMQAGVHFGHRVMRWHPKMKPFIYGEKQGIHIINLLSTAEQLEKAVGFVNDKVEAGGLALIVGTKRQAKDIVSKYAGEAGVPYIVNRWPGGLLTNFATIRRNLTRMRDLEKQKEESFVGYTKKEALMFERELKKLYENFYGVRDLERLPAVLVVLDTGEDMIAVKEANKLGIPVIGLCDTNVDPDSVTIAIPANDDASASLEMMTKLFTEVVKSASAKAEEAKEAGIKLEEKTEEIIEEVDELVPDEFKKEEEK